MLPVVKGDRDFLFFNLIKLNHRAQVDRYKVGRGRSIYDNVSDCEMMIVNDEDPDKIGQSFETCVTLMKSSKGNGWFVWDVDEGFRSQDKWLQDLVDEYNEKKNLIELQELVEQAQYEEAFDA